jgi:hypothetical protein
MIQLIFWIIIICVAVAYWQWAVVLVVLWIAFKVWMDRAKKNQARLSAAEKGLALARYHIEKAASAKTLASKERNCEEAIQLIYTVRDLDPDAEVLKEADQLLAFLHACRLTFVVRQALGKAEKAEFKGQKKAAVGHYLEALFVIRKKGISDADFSIANVVFEDTGLPVSKTAIKARAVAMGWSGIEKPDGKDVLDAECSVVNERYELQAP